MRIQRLVRKNARRSSIVQRPHCPHDGLHFSSWNKAQRSGQQTRPHWKYPFGQANAAADIAAESVRTITTSRRILTRVLRMALLHRNKRECANCSTEAVSRGPNWASRHDVSYSLTARGSVTHFTFGELRLSFFYSQNFFVFRTVQIFIDIFHRDIFLRPPTRGANWFHVPHWVFHGTSFPGRN